jgi:hypothetical protein
MTEKRQILRYDNSTNVITQLDPIDAITTWITGLNSISYTSDLLISTHNYKRGKDTRNAAHTISTYAKNALAFLDQAYSGPPDHSYLPLYYSILNLSKIYIIVAGHGGSLETNRWHGVSYNPQAKASHDILTERITLKPGGIFPLFYQVLTTQKWIHGDKNISLRNIIPYIRGTSHEFAHAYKEAPPYQIIKIIIEGDDKIGYRLTASTYNKDHPNGNKLRFLKAITGFRQDTGSQNIFHTPFINAINIDQAWPRLLKNVRRYLLYEPLYSSMDTILGAVTPISNCKLLLPEEIPIWLTFFYLSSVVRYNPEFLDKLEDSKAWPILLCLRKDSIFNFLRLFWSFIQKSEYRIVIQ